MLKGKYWCGLYFHIFGSLSQIKLGISYEAGPEPKLNSFNVITGSRISVAHEVDEEPLKHRTTYNIHVWLEPLKYIKSVIIKLLLFCNTVYCFYQYLSLS